MIAGPGVCSSFRLELLQGLHNFAGHEFRMALYTKDADLNVDTTERYAPIGEVVGVGYTSGGQILRNPQLRSVARSAFATWDDPVWSQSSLVARGALIYNATSELRAVAILDFLVDRSSNTGEFRVQLPPPSPSTALIRLL